MVAIPIKAVVTYDGTDFHGWGRQIDPAGEFPDHGSRRDSVPTIQGAIESALERIVGAHVSTVVAGRTDAGVHAVGQVFSAHLPPRPDFNVDLRKLKRSLNGMCGPAIAIRSLEEVDAGFSARFDAKSRRYVYRYHTGGYRDPFTWKYMWNLRHQLDVDRMRRAAECLVGTHDFSAFCKARAVGGPVRNIHDVTVVQPEPDQIELSVEARSFCHQMVRSIAGLLEGIGACRHSIASAAQVLESRDRNANSGVAPPQGLTLWSVKY